MAAAHYGDREAGSRYAYRANLGLKHALAQGDRSEVILAGFVCMSWVQIWLNGTENGIEFTRYALRLIQATHGSSDVLNMASARKVLCGTSLVTFSMNFRVSTSTHKSLVHGGLRLVGGPYRDRSISIVCFRDIR